ncbi:MAG: nuclear transport factor 2 family protein [Deltaproteobacteria bacterium]|nr:nuclear transport factor 2 family protein [Deltaproteobacteria bacterium]
MTRADDHELDPKDHLEILALVSEGSTRAGIREWAETRWSSLRKEGVSPRHFQTNTQLTKTAPGTVRGTTQLLLVWLTSPDGAAQLKGVARYDDEFRHTSEGWRFHRRSIGSDAHPEEPAKNR